MFQKFKNIFSSVTIPERTLCPKSRIPEDRKSVNLSLIVKNSDHLQLMLNEHSDPLFLTEIIISSTHVSEIPMMLGAFRNLVRLILSQNLLTHFPWTILYLQKLKVLDLSFNHIIELPMTLGYLINLEYLDVRDNELTYIPFEIAVLSNLADVRLEGNKNLKSPPISNLPHSIKDLKTYLLDQSQRSDSFSHTRFSYSSAPLIPCLRDLAVRVILEYNIDYLRHVNVPPLLKTHIQSESVSRDNEFYVMKCSRCNNYFSMKKTFKIHHC